MFNYVFSGQAIAATSDFALKYFKGSTKSTAKPPDLTKMKNWEPNSTLTSQYCKNVTTITDNIMEFDLTSPIIPRSKNYTSKINYGKTSHSPEVQKSIPQYLQKPAAAKAKKIPKTKNANEKSLYAAQYAPKFVSAKSELQRQNNRDKRDNPTAETHTTSKKGKFVSPLIRENNENDQLKGIDKKLVEAIENEIMDSKDSIKYISTLFNASILRYRPN
jgi:hypothetical protein